MQDMSPAHNPKARAIQAALLGFPKNDPMAITRDNNPVKLFTLDITTIFPALFFTISVFPIALSTFSSKPL